MNVAELFTSYRKVNELTQQELAEAINRQVGLENFTSKQSISLWENGANKPYPNRMKLLYQQSDGSLKTLALSVLKVLDAEPVQG